MNWMEQISREFNIDPASLTNLLRLVREKYSVPYLARFRSKEIGELNAFRIHKILRRVHQLKSLEDKRAKAIQMIEQEGKLTPELKEGLKKAQSKREINDFLLPYRPNKQGKAINAIKAGLRPLADLIWEQKPLGGPLEALAEGYLNPHNGLTTTQQVLEGVRAILVEKIAEDPATRKALRDEVLHSGTFRAQATKRAHERPNSYQDFYDFSAPVSQVASHHFMAIQKGERQGFLATRIDIDDEAILNTLTKKLLHTTEATTRFQLEAIITKAYHERLKPDIINDVKQILREGAHQRAVNSFAAGLYQQLMYPPLGRRRILSVYPKDQEQITMVALDEDGKILAQESVRLTAEDRKTAWQTLKDLCHRHRPAVLALPRIADKRIALLRTGLTENNISLPPLSVKPLEPVPAAIPYPEDSATDQGDWALQAALAIGRRLRDPLEALVRLNPGRIPVGPYQGEIEPNQLAKRLKDVIEMVVARVGVDINRAPWELIRYVPGLNEDLAKRLVAARPFKDGQDLKAVPGVTDAIFEQCAPFLYTDKLQKPSDPRGHLRVIRFDPDVREARDLKEGQTLKGYVTHLAPFGVFVDVGLAQDALIHRSELSRHLQGNFKRVFKLGQVITVKVTSVNKEKQRAEFGLVDPGQAGHQVRLPKQQGKEKDHHPLPRKKRPAAASAGFGTLGDKFAQILPTKF